MNRLGLTLRMIKFSHSIFALPFALTSAWLAADGIFLTNSFLGIIFCMITARSAAMSFNRIVDRDIDALNPRTKNREIPAGLISVSFAKYFCLLNSLLFIIGSFYLGRLCGYLSPIALFIVLGYSYAKRFTSCSQIWLGVALGIAPIAAAIAIRGNEIPLFSVSLGLGVMFWVAGFDILYALQDEDFDREQKLKSLVVRFGQKKALRLARIFHGLCIPFIAGCYQLARHPMVAMGIFLILFLFLFYEHSLIVRFGLKKIDAAFFTTNGLLAMVIFLMTVAFT